MLTVLVIFSFKKQIKSIAEFYKLSFSLRRSVIRQRNFLTRLLLAPSKLKNVTKELSAKNKVNAVVYADWKKKKSLLGEFSIS